MWRHWDDFCLEIWFGCCIYQLCSLCAFQWRVWNVQCLMHTLVKEGGVQAPFSKPTWQCWNISTQWSPVAVSNQGTKWGAVWRSSRISGPQEGNVRRKLSIEEEKRCLGFRAGSHEALEISTAAYFLSLETETAGSRKEIHGKSWKKGNLYIWTNFFMTFGDQHVNFSGV